MEVKTFSPKSKRFSVRARSVDRCQNSPKLERNTLVSKRMKAEEDCIVQNNRSESLDRNSKERQYNDNNNKRAEQSQMTLEQALETLRQSLQYSNKTNRTIITADNKTNDMYYDKSNSVNNNNNYNNDGASNNNNMDNDNNLNNNSKVTTAYSSSSHHHKLLDQFLERKRNHYSYRSLPRLKVLGTGSQQARHMTQNRVDNQLVSSPESPEKDLKQPQGVASGSSNGVTHANKNNHLGNNNMNVVNNTPAGSSNQTTAGVQEFYSKNCDQRVMNNVVGIPQQAVSSSVGNGKSFNNFYKSNNITGVSENVASSQGWSCKFRTPQSVSQGWSCNFRTPQPVRRNNMERNKRSGVALYYELDDSYMVGIGEILKNWLNLPLFLLNYV